MVHRAGKGRRGREVPHELQGERAYGFVIDGAVAVNGQRLGQGDQRRITGEAAVTLTAEEARHVMVIDLV